MSEIDEAIAKVISGTSLELWHEFEVGIFKRQNKFVVSWEEPKKRLAEECAFIEAEHAVAFYNAKVKENGEYAVKPQKKKL